VRAPRLASAAAAVLALEGAGIIVIALIEMFGLGSGDAASLPTAIALVVLTLIGGVALAAFAWGVMRGRGWARSGGIVLQLLGLGLAVTSFGVDPVPWSFILLVGIPTAIGFVLLIASARVEAASSAAPAEPADERAPADD